MSLTGPGDNDEELASCSDDPAKQPTITEVLFELVMALKGVVTSYSRLVTS